MILLTGFLAGVTYPTACRLYGDPIKAEELVEWRGVTGSGAIYAADLFGGAAGGIIGALLILPQFGIYRFLFIAASFKMLSAIILTVNRRR
jgi:predicted membrane-bound spermidine synthase